MLAGSGCWSEVALACAAGFGMGSVSMAGLGVEIRSMEGALSCPPGSWDDESCLEQAEMAAGD